MELKAGSWFSGGERASEEERSEVVEAWKETSGCNIYGPYLDCSDGPMDTCICQNSPDCIF